MTFGYRINPYGPPTAFKSATRPTLSFNRLSVDDPWHPLSEKWLRELKADEEHLSINDLRQKYPYVAEPL